MVTLGPFVLLIFTWRRFDELIDKSNYLTRKAGILLEYHKTRNTKFIMVVARFKRYAS